MNKNNRSLKNYLKVMVSELKLKVLLDRLEDAIINQLSKPCEMQQHANEMLEKEFAKK